MVPEDAIQASKREKQPTVLAGYGAYELKQCTAQHYIPQGAIVTLTLCSRVGLKILLKRREITPGTGNPRDSEAMGLEEELTTTNFLIPIYILNIYPYTQRQV